MAKKLIMIDVDTQAVVLKEVPRKDDLLEINPLRFDPVLSTRAFYSKLIAMFSPPTVLPVLRWEDAGAGQRLMCGNKMLAGVIRSEYEGDGITWFITNEQPWHGAFSVTEARRAAEKALGFPDDLIVEVL